jgi:hypothetical protein
VRRRLSAHNYFNLKAHNLGCRYARRTANHHFKTGASNTSTVRLEGHAAFGTERTAAAARVMP